MIGRENSNLIDGLNFAQTGKCVNCEWLLSDSQAPSEVTFLRLAHFYLHVFFALNDGKTILHTTEENMDAFESMWWSPGKEQSSILVQANLVLSSCVMASIALKSNLKIKKKKNSLPSVQHVYDNQTNRRCCWTHTIPLSAHNVSFKHIHFSLNTKTLTTH